MSLSTKQNLNIVVLDDVEVARATRSAPTFFTARFESGDGRAIKFEHLAPSGPGATSEAPKEAADTSAAANGPNMVRIGNGAFGQVYLVTGSADPRTRVALKIANMVGGQTKAMLDREVEIMKAVSGQPNFLIFIESWYQGSNSESNQPTQCVMAMEYVPFNLARVVDKNHEMGRKPSLEVLRRLTKHLVDGGTYLHSKNVIHHDIKSENIMVKTPSGRRLDDIEDLDAELLQSTFKLIDFGGAEIVSGDCRQEMAWSKHRFGTLAFMSMDKFHVFLSHSQWYNPFIADAFAVGCTIFSVADTDGFIEMKRQKRSRAWVPPLAFLEQAYCQGNLGQLRGSKLLSLLSQLIADRPEVLLSMIDENVF